MKTLLRIAVSLERIAAALERMAGTPVYTAPGAPAYGMQRCIFCHQQHPSGLPCPTLVVT